MSTQIWEIEGEIIGSFFIVSVEEIKVSELPKNPIVQEFLVLPEFNDKKEQTGKFKIKIIFKVESKDEKPPPNLIADIGREIFNSYIDLLVFISGDSVRMINNPTLKHNYPETNKYRCITFPSQQAEVRSPVPLSTLIFKKILEQKHNQILAWFRKALQEKDIINSTIALFIPLEILANQFTCEEKIIEKCDNCGYEKKLRPGMRIQVENFLINEIGYENNQFLKIWKLRNDIFHGRLSMTLEQIRDLHSIKRELTLAIIKGMKKLIGIDSSEFPKEEIPGPLFADSFLDIEYTVPEKKID